MASSSDALLPLTSKWLRTHTKVNFLWLTQLKFCIKSTLAEPIGLSVFWVLEEIPNGHPSVHLCISLTKILGNQRNENQKLVCPILNLSVIMIFS